MKQLSGFYIKEMFHVKQSDEQKFSPAMFNRLNPVTGVEIYYGGIAVVKRTRSMYKEKKTTKREAIKKLSRKSMARLKFVASVTPVNFVSMITLTYAKNWPRNGKEVKRHLNDFLRWYTNHLGGQYLWFLEFQKRGAPHIHILVQKRFVTDGLRAVLANKWTDIVTDGYSFPYFDLSRKRYATIRGDMIVFNNRPKVWEEIRKRDGAKRYVIKYAAKFDQKSVPDGYENVGRFYGWSRLVSRSIRRLDFIEAQEDVVRLMFETQGKDFSQTEILPRVVFGISWEVILPNDKDAGTI